MTTKPDIVTRAEWGANESLAFRVARLRARQDGVRAPHRQRQRLHAPRRRPRSSAASTPTTPSRCTGATSATTSSSTATAPSTKAATEASPGRHRRPGARASTPGARASRSSAPSRSATPPSAAVTSLERLLEWKLDVHHVDPLGTGDAGLRLRPEVRDRAARDVPGHRRAPRRQLHRLPRRQAVRAAAQHPQGRGAHRSAQDLRLHRRGPGDQPQRRRRAATAPPSGSPSRRPPPGRLEIRDDAGVLVRHLTGDGTVVETTWAGRDDDGKLLPDGVYSLQADATSADGEARSATATLRLDTVAPRIASAARHAGPVQPQRRRAGRRRHARVPAGRGRDGARVSVVDADGERAAPRDGLGGRDHGRPEGRRGTAASRPRRASSRRRRAQATLLLELRDAAGNTTSAAPHRDRRPDAGA